MKRENTEPWIIRFSVVLAALMLSTFVNPVNAQPDPSRKDVECSCRDAFDELVAKVEANYVGYHIDVRANHDAEYRRHTEALRARARRTSPEKCIFVLQDFLRFCRDGHLFVGNRPRLTAEELAHLSNTAERIGRGEDDIRRYLDTNATRLDPVEGFWYAKDGYRVGIVRDKKPGLRDFVAVMLSDGVAGWKPGQVKAEFRRLRDGSYDVVFNAEDHSRRYPHVYHRGQRGGAAIRRGLLLHMPPITWGKAYPLSSDEQGLLDPVDPRRPTIRALSESTVVVSVPSHSPEYATLLNSLVEKYRDRILRAENLVIDIRGDEGGSSWMTRALMPFLVTPTKRPSRYGRDAHSVVLSSPDNIKYFEQMQSQGWIPAKLVERMRANPGKVIRFADADAAGAAPTASPADTQTPLPRNVAILIDGAVVSAGEAFVLNAMKNEKVTLFGENSGGVIDYQSTTIINLRSCRSLGLHLG